jgi:hypothetical protein
MIYRLTCRCGRAFEVDDRAVGKRFRCTGCGRRVHVDQGLLQEVDVYRLACECGTAFRVQDKAIGGTFECPGCRRAVQIDRERLTKVRRKDDRVPDSPRLNLPVDFSTGKESTGP